MLDERSNEAKRPVVGDQLVCPLCGATIAAGSRKCASCAELVTVSTPPKKHRFLMSPLEWVVVFAIIVVMIALLLPAVQSGGRGGASRSQCKDSLRQIGLALFNYHDDYGSFPPAYIADESGRPLHSWRVLLLPYLGQRQLYDEYRFDEPWNGPHNATLAGRALELFNCASENRKNGRTATPMTSYVAVIGPETVWPGSRPLSRDEITDRMANTLCLVEVGNSGIHWMEPRDLHLLQMAPTINSKSGQGISSVHVGGAMVLKCDGAVWFLSENLPASTVRALLTRAGGEEVTEY